MLPFPLDVSLMMFFIYGFIGWVVEVIYYGITEGKFINRGFLNGALCPVYGIGFYCVIWFFRPIMDSFPMLFFGSAIVCTTVELIAGAVLYAIFHLRWWDYSDYRLNFKGFICLRFAIYWGIACSLGMYMLHPAVLKLINSIPPMARLVILFVACVVTVIDIIVTITAIVGFNKKVRFLNSVSGVFRMPSDKIGSSIYGTVDTIVTKTAPAVQLTQNDYTEFRETFAAHRKAERELARKNRAEERQLLARYASEGRQGIVNTSKAASKAAVDKSKAAVKKVKNIIPEAKLALRIRMNRNDENAETIRVLQQHYVDVLGADSDEEVFDDLIEMQ
ncbi:MAG: putative ABC transporter permease [Clostridiales bacterium]|nr:putative ABC transporter permease [Clostridiales bacterium]